jgi:LCP family protein required for cell wall assembly
MTWANGRLTHVSALSTAPATPGTTYLLAGSDARGDGAIPLDGTLGARSDTVMVLHVPPSGPVALISLPRDTYVNVPGHGPAKLNAAYSWGGAALLVLTVEKLTGLTVDHYVEVGFAGLEDVVNAVGGISLCSNLTVNDHDSGMVWTPGCHEVAGAAALSFARMRKADPTGDIGREQRQQQVIAAITSKISTPSLAFQPSTQVSLIRAGTGSLAVSKGTDIIDMARLALAFRDAKGPGGITGTPPIASMDYWPGHGLGSTVELDPAKTPAFFEAIKNGTLPAGPVGGAPKA